MERRLGFLAVTGLLIAAGVWTALGQGQTPRLAEDQDRSATAAGDQSLRPAPTPSPDTGPDTAPATAAHNRVETEPMAPSSAAKQDLGAQLGAPAGHARARLAALSARGRQLTTYRVRLWQMLPGIEASGVPVPDLAVDVTPEDCSAENGKTWAALRGLPAGTFRFEVIERDHANTLSAPVALTEGPAIPEVVVRLSTGGALTGKVVDERGRPIPGAVVRTDANEPTDRNGEPAAEALSRYPSFFSQAQASTDAKGQFRLSRLAFADYMIRIGHPEYCPGLVRDLSPSRRNRSVDAGTVRLARGAIVEGTTRAAGRPSGPIKVMVSAQSVGVASGQRGALPAEDRRTFQTSAISDGRGHFRLIQRVPPGTFTARAIRPGPPSGSPSNISTPSGSEQTFTVAPDQHRVFLHLDLPAR